MRTLYVFILVFFIGFCAQSQIINIPDANFKAKLLAANSSNHIAVGTWPTGYTGIDTNGNGEIEVSEAAVITQLNVENSAIVAMTGISGFTQLTLLNCKNNNINALDLNGLTQLWNIDCSNNALTALNVNTLVSLTTLDCSHNQLASLNAEQISNKFTRLVCSYNNLTSLMVPNFFGFEDQGVQEMRLDCSHNQLTQVTFDYSAGSEDFSSLDLSYNNFTDLTLSNMWVYFNGINVSNNPFNNLTFSNVGISSGEPDGQGGFSLNNTSLIQITSLPRGEYVMSISNSPNLISIDMKNGNPNVFYDIQYIGDDEIYVPYGVTLENNPSLAMICCDTNEVGYVATLVPGVAVTEYCDFVPGGAYNTITGTVGMCLGGDLIDTSIKVTINNSDASFTNNLNTYNAFTSYGNQNVSLILPETSYYTITPPNYLINFTTLGNTQTANFCLTPNGNHPDLEMSMVATTPARPGFNASYKLIYKNKGTETQSGNVTLDFTGSILDFVSASPATDTQSAGALTWNFTNLAPFETRELTFVLHVNSPVETPAVNIGDVLVFNASVNSQTDETPNDNAAVFNQTVVGSYDPNDKSVAEGDFINPSQIDDYLHYTIRFQNTGNFAAENVVVKDTFQWLPSQFDLASLQVIAASHPFYARQSNSRTKIEFFFENINLPPASADEPGSHGYVTFKIKPYHALAVGQIIENQAAIYFDYNFPMVTNTVTTTIAPLATQAFGQGRLFAVYPNPASTQLNIQSDVKIDSAEIYNNLGQKVLKTNHTNAIDISGLSTGVYMIKAVTVKGSDTQKFIKL
jgi:uncharacterized repeat protein (TIGR01451 family)